MSESSRRVPVVAVTALVIAVAALAAAGWALLRLSESGTAVTTYSASEQADAKTKSCAAFELVRDGVTRNTNLQAPGGSGDITGSLATAANARISLYDGGQYLLARTGPATPTDLADAVEQFGNTLMDIGAAATNGTPNSDPAQTTRLQDADTQSAAIGAICD